MSHTDKSRAARKRLADALEHARAQAKQEQREGYAMLDRDGYGNSPGGHAFGGDKVPLTHELTNGRYEVCGRPVCVRPRVDYAGGRSRVIDGGVITSAGNIGMNPNQMVRLAKALLAGSVGIWDVHVDDMGIMDALRKAESAHGDTNIHRQLQASSGLQVLDAEFEEDD